MDYKGKYEFLKGYLMAVNVALAGIWDNTKNEDVLRVLQENKKILNEMEVEKWV